jgi:hypothetical protein
VIGYGRYGYHPKQTVFYLTFPPTLKRISAAREHTSRCKLSVIAESVAHVKQTLSPLALRPYDDHFHPAYNKVNDQKEDARRSLQTINIIPLEEQVGGMQFFLFFSSII